MKLGEGMANTSNEKKTSKLQWFFLLFFIPAVFFIVVGVIILSILGINVFEAGKHVASQIPGVQSLLEEEEKVDTPTVTVEDLERKDREIVQLERQLEEKEEEIRALENELEELTLEEEEDSEELPTEIQNDLKELAQVYESMSPGKAAAIMENMSTEEVLFHMSEMNVDTRGAILAKMDPEKAAEVMNAFSQK